MHCTVAEVGVDGSAMLGAQPAGMWGLLADQASHLPDTAAPSTSRKAVEMAVTSMGFVPTANAARYIQQLVKHWNHKLEIDYRDGIARIPFNSDVCLVLETREGGMAMTLTSHSDEDDVRFRNIFEQHLDRFAFREALAYDWTRL